MFRGVGSLSPLLFCRFAQQAMFRGVEGRGRKPIYKGSLSAITATFVQHLREPAIDYKVSLRGQTDPNRLRRLMPLLLALGRLQSDFRFGRMQLFRALMGWNQTVGFPLHGKGKRQNLEVCAIRLRVALLHLLRAVKNKDECLAEHGTLLAEPAELALTNGEDLPKRSPQFWASCCARASPRRPTAFLPCVAPLFPQHVRTTFPPCW